MIFSFSPQFWADIENLKLTIHFVCWVFVAIAVVVKAML